VPALAAAIFVFSVLLTLGAAGFFADRLDHLAPRLGMPEALVGLLTALAADAPEISSALIALAKGAKGVSLGVVLGSNVFNLAAMIGLSAVVAGSVRIEPRSLAVEGAVGLLGALLAAGVIVGAIAPGLALLAFAAVLVPYLILLTRRPTAGRPSRERPSHRLSETPSRRLASTILLAVALIVAGSEGMVRSALTLAGEWHLSAALVGVLVLAVLTSLPNAFTAVRLGSSSRGAALVSETLNSNTINLLGGVMAPALIVGLAPASGLVRFDLGWLIAMTAVALLLLARRRGAGRAGGALLIVLYGVFVAVQLAHAG
jgi:cation:H+ antiporter